MIFYKTIKNKTDKTAKKWRSEAGSLTVEALLVLSVFLFCMLFMIALVQTSGQLLCLDRALTATIREITAASYTLQQGIHIVAGNTSEDLIIPDSITEAWAEHCLQKHLADYVQMKPALVWKQTVAPQNRGQNGSEDVLLRMEFWPARVKTAAAAWLPKGLVITLVKRQKAWLIGKELLPYRGLEESAELKKTGPLVFITRWGTHYHRENCRYLRISKIPSYLNTLAAFYMPCSVCRPDA